MSAATGCPPTEWSASPLTQVSVDLASGHLRALFPTAADRFVAGPLFLVPTPAEITVKFERDGSGAVSVLRWQEATGPARRAPSIAYRREDVRFTNGGVTLAGTLTLPPSAGPHPAVILVHGSGARPRDLGT